MFGYWTVSWIRSVPPRGSGWVRSVYMWIYWLRTHPLPRGGTDCIQVWCQKSNRSLYWKKALQVKSKETLP